MRVLLTSDAAALLGVAPSTIRNLAASGELPCRQTAGGHRRFLESDLLAYRGRARATADAERTMRAAVWAAAASEVLRAAIADLGADTAEGRAFARASDVLRLDLRDEARAAAPSRLRHQEPGQPGPAAT
jgi:excisionase family DNA binding protein